jgi:hypothetical protein
MERRRLHPHGLKPMLRGRVCKAYRSAAERKLEVFTSRENVALSREEFRLELPLSAWIALRLDAKNKQIA